MKIEDKKKEVPDGESETSSGMEYVDKIIYRLYYKYLKFSFTKKVFTIVAIVYLFFWGISLLKCYLL